MRNPCKALVLLGGASEILALTVILAGFCFGWIRRYLS
jgi:hypothetical protein